MGSFVVIQRLNPGLSCRWVEGSDIEEAKKKLPLDSHKRGDAVFIAPSPFKDDFGDSRVLQAMGEDNEPNFVIP